ncbi:MAG TPA: restriction endonuclease [Solirubrobacterales bacterium]
MVNQGTWLLRVARRTVGRVVDTALRFTFLGLFVLYRIIAFAYDRGREKKHAGVLRLLEADSTERWEERTAREADCVLGYAEFAHTGFHPDYEDDQGAALRLAGKGKPADMDEWDRDVWRMFNLDDPATRRRYQEQVPLGRVLQRTRHCIYCSTPLVRGETADLRLVERDFVWQYQTKECPFCGWWCVTYKLEQRLFAWDEEDYFHAYAVMRRFDPLALDTPLSLARDFLSRNPHKLARFDPFRFESLMADCLRDYFGDGEIRKIGGRNDRGIDIKVIFAGGQTLLVQVKRHSDFLRREGVDVVRALHGVMLREGVPRGMVISTAHDYTQEARAEVEQTSQNLQGYSMDLLAYDDVVSLLGEPSQPRRSPWEAQGIRIDQPPSDWQGGEDWIDRSVLPAPIQYLY